MKRILKEIFEFSLIAVFIILPIRLFIAQPFVVNGASMFPTFHDGDYLIVDQISYQFKDPERGSVVIFKYPNDTSKFFIKRIIGLPGEKVTIKDGLVTINDSLTLDDSYITEKKIDNFETQLGEDEYFVMGDNRAHSSDSRAWGPLGEEYIVGRPLIQLLPIQSLDLLPGDYSN